MEDHLKEALGIKEFGGVLYVTSCGKKSHAREAAKRLKSYLGAKRPKD